jgi:NAD(P)-dependent dehydrogenase (short-subunit alcohol dehydrogenase family)
MGRLDGKVAFVTGGTSGIGRAAVVRLASEGAKLAFSGSNREAAESLTAETGAFFIPQDISDAEAWPGVMQAIKDRFGRLDIAFANAGIEGEDAGIEKIGIVAWRRIIDVNLNGTMYTCKFAIELMKQNPGGSCGSIIVNSSMNAILALPENIGYSTTKGAMRIMAKSIAVYCAKHKLNIRCNSIHPGVIETPIMLAAMESTGDAAAARKYLEKLSPLERLGTVEEVAALVAFLASDEALFLTGAEISIDGATTAGLSGI